ncbi:hypothetical protein [Arthrobacter sp. ERGS1:01]|uniref:hypothetical protein n=1 Tax=Arthrobacter sp. ERGS1:01 TaxID=1704044 RepID=UPI000AE8A528|nr:hypothetical protein [Arthrobacter sp. ERGS1:01]
MDQQEPTQHAEIHEGGYGAPMPEDEMPAPGTGEAGREPAEGTGVEPGESDQPDGTESA